MCDIEAGKARVKEILESDYARWTEQTSEKRRVSLLVEVSDYALTSEQSESKADEDCHNRYTIIFKDGRNYIKVIRSEGIRESVIGFIVRKETKGFKVGDILKAASWHAPALNFARGHVDDEELSLCWAGI